MTSPQAPNTQEEAPTSSAELPNAAVQSEEDPQKFGRFSGSGIFSTIERGKDFLYGTETWDREDVEISSGIAKAVKTGIRLDTESQASFDTLDTLTIRGQRKGTFALLSNTADGREVLLGNETGNIKYSGTAILVLAEDRILLQYDGTNWVVIAGSQGAVLLGVRTATSIDIMTWADDIVLCDASAGAFTTFLPPLVASGKKITIKKVDSSGNAVTVDQMDIATIDGASTKVLTAQYDAIQVVSESPTDWWIV